MKHFLLFFGLLLHQQGKPVMKTDTFSFMFEEKKLTGLLDVPEGQKPSGIVLLIPGSGQTTMVKGNGYYKRLRQFFTEQGFACCVWDKPGCGKSEGKYNDSDTEGSAREAIAAIEALKHENVPGSETIGLWSLSRGGYVCPSIIQKYPSIAFWISVSGPDEKETFGYLLEKNFLAEGRSEEETALLMKAWRSNLDIALHGGTYEENQKATEPLRNDPFYQFICEESPKPTKEAYLKWQESLMTGKNLPIDEKTGLQVYFPDLEKALSNIHCPVLAVFGEKDSQVPWQRSMELYQNTMGKNAVNTLTIKTFPDGNHNLFKCKTGGFREKLEKIEFCDDYLETMSAWLKDRKKGQ